MQVNQASCHQTAMGTVLRVSTWITSFGSAFVATPALAHSEQGAAIDF
jgi:hypothetical protein